MSIQEPGAWRGRPPEPGDRPDWRDDGDPGFGDNDPPPDPVRHNGVGTAALILGVLALVFSWTALGGIVLGVVALILGIVGRVRVRRGIADNPRSATVGIVLGIIGIVIAVVLVVVFVRAIDSPRGRQLVTCFSSAQQAADSSAAVNRCLSQYRDAGSPGRISSIVVVRAEVRGG